MSCARRGDRTAACALFEQALTAFVTLGHKRGIASVLEGFAYLAQCEQQYERALTLAGGAAAVRRASGAAPRPDEQAMFERSLEPAWQSLDPATAQATWTAGQRLSLDDAIQLAFDRPLTITIRN